jgi:hypothetical protein
VVPVVGVLEAWLPACAVRSFDGWMMTVRVGVMASEVSERLDSLIVGAGDLLDKIDDGSPKLCVRNLHESFGEVEPVGGSKIVRYEFWKGSVGLRTLLAGDIRGSFEEERCRHLKYVRNLLQAAGADAVYALFIFLQLLERDAERIAYMRLGHAEHQAAHADALSDVRVGRVHSVPWHCCPVAGLESRYTTLPCVWKGVASVRPSLSAATQAAMSVAGITHAQADRFCPPSERAREMRSIGHPDFQYTPWSPERRAAASKAANPNLRSA